MKSLCYIILLSCNILNFMPYLILRNPIILDRESSNFLISKLLNSDYKNNKNEILAQLQITELLEDDYNYLLDLEKNVTVPASQESIEEWEYLNSSKTYTSYPALIRNFLNNKDFFEASEIALTMINKAKFEKSILKIYNFLLNFFSIEELSYINLGVYVHQEEDMFSKDEKDVMRDTMAITVSNFFQEKKSYQSYSCVYLNINIYDSITTYKNYYKSGYFSSNLEEYGSIIHEYGHILSSYLFASNRQEYKNTYNKTISKKCSELRLIEKAERPHEYFTDEFNFNFIEILLKKIIKNNPNKMTSVRRKLALWTALPSLYARSNDSRYREMFELEYFAEAFAYWIVTPDALKNYYWELIDSSFQELLKKTRFRSN